MKTLFICDQKQEWDRVINLLKAHFPKIDVVCVLRGDDAIEYMMSDGPFHFFLIDAELKNQDPKALGEKIRDITGEVPLVYVGTEPIIKSRVITEDVYEETDLDRLLYRPFDHNQFKEVITKVVKWIEDEQFQESLIEEEEDSFLPMRLRNFYLHDTVDFNVFLRITRNKFIPVIEAGKPYTEGHIQQYAKRHVKYLYLRRDEHIKFLDNSIANCLTLLKSRKLSLSDSLKIQIKSCSLIQEFLTMVGVSESVSNLTSEVINTTSQNFEQISGMKRFISNFPFSNSSIPEQAVLCHYLCEAILAEMDWKSEITKKKLGLASLLHDCTLSNEYMCKITTLEPSEFETFTEEEIEEFKSHYQDAAKLANYFPGFSDVDFIILQHHELPDGKGFPGKVPTHKITSLSALFIIVSHLVCKLSQYGISKQTVSFILDDMEDIFKIGNFREPLNILLKIFR